MYNDLKNKVAFITGAAHGQGRVTAIALAKEGVHIVAFDLAQTLKYPGYELGSENELHSLKQECELHGVSCLVFTGDVRVDDDINNAVTKTVEQLKKIDILFNNAGICAYGLAHELTEKEWDAMLDINRLSHYAASKWGLTGLTKSWAIELAPYNIRVISIHPTGVNTPMNDGLAALEGSTPKEIAERSAGNLINVPWVEAEDVANAVIFLVSDKSRFITGSQFVLDAGLLTR